MNANIEQKSTESGKLVVHRRWQNDVTPRSLFENVINDISLALKTNTVFILSDWSEVSRLNFSHEDLLTAKQLFADIDFSDGFIFIALIKNKDPNLVKLGQFFVDQMEVENIRLGMFDSLQQGQAWLNAMDRALEQDADIAQEPTFVSQLSY